jgi:hypothetical protein
VCGDGSAVDAGNNGSAAVNGVIAPACAAVSAVSAIPSSVNVGGAINLQAQGVDSFGSSSDVAFSWAITGGTGSGTFSNVSVASPTFTCSSPGPVTATVTAGVADGGASCTNNTASVQLTCTACTGDLSNIGTGDFRISLALTTTQNAQAAILNQRPTCNAGTFWDLRLLAGGTLQMETDDNGGLATITTLQTTATVNDGNPHQVVVERVSGMLTVSIDGVSTGAASNASLGALPPLQQGTDVCVGQDQTTLFVGTIADVCVNR